MAAAIRVPYDRGGVGPAGYPVPVAGPARVSLRVSPRAQRTELVGRHGAAWKVRVAASPEAGRANEAALSLIADAVARPRASISLVSGASSRDKVVEVAGLAPDELERRLAARSARRGPRT